MATSEQIVKLVNAYMENDSERFKTIVLQIAAHEARLGHVSVANELQKELQKKSVKNIAFSNNANQLLAAEYPKDKLSDLVVPEEIYSKINRVLVEFRNRKKLYLNGLANRRKILIEGESGTGKTFTASIIASELSLPLYTIQIDKLVTKFMGETSAKLRQVFDAIESNIGVYLFDEFDAIGAKRDFDNEVGEMRRILNSYLQFLENDSSQSIIVAATNNAKLLDNALFRRFDDVWHYTLPTENERKILFSKLLSFFDESFVISDNIIDASIGLSHAEIEKVCMEAKKEALLSSSLVLSEDSILCYINERKEAYSEKRA